MTIHVNIGEAKTRLSELLAAALRGEEVVLQKAGVPQARIVPIAQASRAEREDIARRRVANIGKYRDQYSGMDLSIKALKADRPDMDERERRVLGLDP